MSEKKTGLKRHNAEEQKQYEREARLQYGPGTVNESIERWNSYSGAEQEAIIAEGNQIYVDLAEAMEAGKEASDRQVVDILERWQDHLRRFYEPSLDMLRGLGQMYNSDPRFIANFQDIHSDLPAYLERVIDHYVDELETAELERMMAEDDELEKRRQNLSR
ncbi:MAG: TipAS antibiotic-recognition domain-containing protein [Chloroflexota bacterium]|nr:TipAS antibiotic-recognition domain-containing protein [Chloroflexota bacterium]